MCLGKAQSGWFCIAMFDVFLVRLASKRWLCVTTAKMSENVRAFDLTYIVSKHVSVFGTYVRVHVSVYICVYIIIYYNYIL